MLTVSEVQPSFLDTNGHLTIQKIWLNLYWTLPLTIIGLGCLFYRVYIKKHPKEIFLLVWSLAIIFASLAQIRFNYYLAINAAILSSIGIYHILDIITYPIPQTKLGLYLQRIFTLLFLVSFLALIIFPLTALFVRHSIPTGILVSKQWYNTLMWLKKNTPKLKSTHHKENKEFNYLTGNYQIPSDLSNHYPYPKNVYGIMSWWDIGHQITYIAERIPNANNHQQGIILQNNALGAAPFFTARNEEEAVANLDALGSRYIIISHDMAKGKFKGITIWCNDLKGWEKKY